MPVASPARRVVAAAVVALALLATGCQSLDDAGQVIGRSDVVNDLAGRLNAALTSTYAADYQLAGGTTASIAVAGTALRPGAHTVTLRHSGGTRVNPVAAVNTRLTVRKAASSLAAKVSPKKIRAKRTKAKVAVTVRTSGFKATGRVTAKVGKKTVGKGTVRNGKVTIKLKKFAKKGTYRVKLTYGGNGYANGSTKTIKVKVRK